MKAKHPIKCKQCGIIDQTRKDVNGNLIIGTDKMMRCPDCSDDTGHASLCRNCCPTKHGTDF